MPAPRPCLVCDEPTSHRDVDGDPVCPECDDLQDAEPVVLGEPVGLVARGRLFVAVLRSLRQGEEAASLLEWLHKIGVTQDTAASLVRNASRRIALESRHLGRPPRTTQRAARPEASRTPNAVRLDRIAALLRCHVDAIEERIGVLLEYERQAQAAADHLPHHP